MTITFTGYITEMKCIGSAEVELTIDTPMDPCYGRPFVVRVPASQAQSWIPGRTVSFTLYALPEAIQQ